MLHRLPPGPLNDAELARLDELLKVHSGEDRFNVDAVDGLFAALFCSPILAMPSEWMPIIWGEKTPEWESPDEFQEISTLLLRHWNHVAKTVEDGTYSPVFTILSTPQGEDSYLAYSWCWGFQAGMRHHEEVWFDEAQPVLQRLLAPITFLSADVVRMARGRKRRTMSQEQYDDYVDQIPMTVILVRQYWVKLAVGEHEGTGSSASTTSKVGRNNPCPCGSGKKYKHCHGVADLH